MFKCFLSVRNYCRLCVYVSEFYSADGVYGEIKSVKSASLFCSFNMTSDNVSVEWYKNGLPLHSNSTYSINSSVAGVSNLTINHVGKFCCLVAMSL